MHAVLVHVRVEPGSEEEALEYLRGNVLPQVKQIPGLLSGYWLAAKDGEGMSVLLFENEDAAQATANAIPNTPRAPTVTLGAIEVREVVAHI